MPAHQRAALLAVYRGPMTDEPEVLQFFAEVWGNQESIPALTERVLGNAALWGADLSQVPGLTERVAEVLGQIVDAGMRGALTDATANP